MTTEKITVMLKIKHDEPELSAEQYQGLLDEAYEKGLHSRNPGALHVIADKLERMHQEPTTENGLKLLQQLHDIGMPGISVMYYAGLLVGNTAGVEV